MIRIVIIVMLFLFEGITFVYADSVKTKWDALNQKSVVLLEQGEFEKALIFAKKAIEVAEKNGGLNNPDVAISLGNLGTIYSYQGKAAEAEPLFMRSLEIYEKKLGLNHPTVTSALGNLALSYKIQGKYIKAESTYKKSLVVLKKLSASNQALPDVEAQTMVNLALLYRAMDRIKEALALEKRADQIKAKPAEKISDKKNIEETLTKVIQKNVLAIDEKAGLMSTVVVHIKNIELNKKNQIVAIGHYETIFTIEGGNRNIMMNVGIESILKNTNAMDEKSVLQIYSRNKQGKKLKLLYPSKKLPSKDVIRKEKFIEEIIRELKKPKKAAPAVQNETRESNLAKIYASDGSADKQYALGIVFFSGKAVKQSYKEALVWFRKAADQGHVEAQYILGEMYRTGQGIEINDSKAFNWYRKAADQGLSDVQARLGVMYIMGKGVKKNINIGIGWLQKAAKQGHAKAQKHLKSITNEISQINK